jgi:hypothetical protein
MDPGAGDVSNMAYIEEKWNIYVKWITKHASCISSKSNANFLDTRLDNLK